MTPDPAGVARNAPPTRVEALEAQLQFQIALFRAENEASDEGVVIVSPQQTWFYYNQAFLTLWGISPELAASDSAAAAQAVAAKTIDPLGFQIQLDYLFAHPELPAQWAEVQLADGRIFERYATLIRDVAGGVLGRLSRYRDVTAQRRTESVLRARAYLAQYAMTHSQDEVLYEALDYAEQLTASRISFCHFLEGDQLTLSFQLWSRRTMAEMCHAQPEKRHHTVSEAGIWADCVRERRPVIHNEYAAIPHRKGLPVGHTLLLRDLVVPVFRGDLIVAVIGVGNKPDAYNLYDVEAIRQLADLVWEIAERKRAEEALRESEERYRLMVEHTPQLVCRWLPDTTLLFVNSSYAAFFDSTPEAMRGQRWLALLSLPEQNDVEEHLATMRRERRPIVYQHPVRMRSGEIRWQEWMDIPLFDAAGEMFEFQSIGMDITARKLAEDALRENRANLEALIENTSDAIWAIDTQYRLLICNSVFQDLFNFTVKHAPGIHESVLNPSWPASVLAEWKSFYGRALQGESHGVEINSSSRPQVWMEYQFSPIRTDTKEIIGASVRGRDITERKLAERALRESEARYRRLVDLSPYLIALTVNGELTFINLAGLKLMGATTPAQVLGRQTLDFVAPDHRAEATQRLAALPTQALESPSPIYEQVLVGLDGVTHVVEIVAVSFKQQDQVAIQYIGRDITAEKQAEHELTHTRQQYADFINTLQGVAWESEEDSGVFTFISPYAEVLLGYPLQRWLIENNFWAAHIYHADRERAVNYSLACARARQAHEFEYRIVAANGQLVWVRDTVTVVARGEQPALLRGIMVDITAHKHAEAARVASELQYRSILHSALDGIWVTDAQGRLLDVNAAYCELSGYQREELLAMTPAELNQLALLEQMWRSIEHNRFDCLHRHKSGRMLTVEVSATYLAENQHFIAFFHDITERKQAEEALRHSEAKLQALFELLPAGVSVLNAERQVVEVNPALEKILVIQRDGLSHGDYLQRQYVHDDGSPMLPIEFASTRAFAEQRPINDIETGVVLEDGRVIWVSVSAAPLPDGGAAVVTTNITERKQAEAALRASEKRYRELFENSLEGVVLSQPTGEILFANPAACQLFGYTEAELQAGGRALIMEPADPRLGVFLAERQQIGHVRSELTMRRKDGTWLECEVSSVIFEGPQGQRQSSMFISDITARKRAAEELAYRNQELFVINTLITAASRVYDFEPLATVALTQLSQLMHLQGGWIQLIVPNAGAVELELVGAHGLSETIQTALKWLPLHAVPQGPAMIDGVLARLAAINQTEGLWAQLPHMHGVLLQTKEKVLGVLGVFRVGAHAFAPTEIQILTTVGHQLGIVIENIHLAGQAAQAEILQEVDRLRSELIANVSHELRTPLGLITVMSTTLVRQDARFDPEIQQEFLQGIVEETDRLAHIVDNLLEASRLQSGRLRLDLHPVNLADLTEKVLAALELQLMEHRVTFHPTAQPILVLVDAKRLEQVLRNLLTNAVKYSPPQTEISIILTTQRAEATICVRDQGIGLTAEDRTRVFERFYRSKQEAVQRVSGAGLGLSISRGLVEAHGGRIWVESELNQGSTFYVALPLHPEYDYA